MVDKGGIKGKPIRIASKQKARDSRAEAMERIMKNCFATLNEVESYARMLARHLGRPTTLEEGLLAYLERMVPFTDDPDSRGRMLLGIAEMRAMLDIPNAEVLQAFHRNELNGFKEMGFAKVRVNAEKDACPTCAKLDGRIMETEIALKELPLPCPECSKKPFPKGGNLCRCRFGAVYIE